MRLLLEQLEILAHQLIVAFNDDLALVERVEEGGPAAARLILEMGREEVLATHNTTIGARLVEAVEAARSGPVPNGLRRIQVGHRLEGVLESERGRAWVFNSLFRVLFLGHFVLQRRQCCLEMLPGPGLECCHFVAFRCD